MKGLPDHTDFVVIGAGVAALRAAIELADAGHVLLLTKKEIPQLSSSDPKTEAWWLSDEDDVILHLQDTLDAGAGLCNPSAVKILIEEGAERINELLQWNKHGAAKLSFEVENPHTRSRRLHAEGEATTKEVLRLLWHRVESLKTIALAPSTFVT